MSSSAIAKKTDDTNQINEGWLSEYQRNALIYTAPFIGSYLWTASIGNPLGKAIVNTPTYQGKVKWIVLHSLTSWIQGNIFRVLFKPHSNTVERFAVQINSNLASTSNSKLKT
ncbi:MAG: hypothetical protein O2897_05750, partial [bacterium]|nr:hypothetical protein [bacterium]